MGIAIDEARKALEDGDWLARKAAIEALDAHSAAAVTDALVAALKDPHPDVQWAATLALALVGNCVPVELLVAGLSARDTQRRTQAAQALGRWDGPAALGPLIAAVMSAGASAHKEHIRNREALASRVYLNLTLRGHAVAYPPLRRTAVLWLGLQGERAPLDLLLRAAADPDELVRVEAMRALARAGERVPVSLLRQALQDDFYGVRDVAADALRARNERLPVKEVRAMLRHPDSERRAFAVKLLDLCDGEISNGALAAVLRRRGDWSGEARKAAALALAQRGERIPVEALLAALYRHWRRPTYMSSDAVAMVAALEKAGEQFPADALASLLVSDAADSFSQLRHAIAQALLAHADRLSLERLLPGLRSENAEIRAHAVAVLGILGDRAPIERLLAMLQDTERRVHLGALMGLANLGERGVGPLVTALGSEDAHIRADAANLLGQLGPLAPIAPLAAATRDADPLVRRAALAALGRNVDRVGRDVACDVVLPACGDEDTWVAQTAIAVLVELGIGTSPHVLEVLMRAARDERGGLRLAAAHALAKLGDHVPTALFVELARDPDYTVRAAAVAALGRWGGYDNIGLLRESLSDPEKRVRLAAVAALAALAARGTDAALAEATTGTDAAPAALTEALQDADFEVCVAALEALQTCGARVPVDALITELGASIPRIRFYAAPVLQKTHPDALAAVAPQAEALLRGEPPGPALRPIAESFVAKTVGEMAAAEEAVPDELIEHLVALLDWPHWEVQLNAAQALGRLQGRLSQVARKKLAVIPRVC